jgi:hypothetical protein
MKLLDLILVLLAILVIGGMLGAIPKHNNFVRLEIESLGYDYEQVYTFCRYTDYLLDDFIKSKGIQKQFELFQEGKISFYKKDNYRGTIIMFEPKEIDSEKANNK